VAARLAAYHNPVAPRHTALSVPILVRPATDTRPGRPRGRAGPPRPRGDTYARVLVATGSTPLVACMQSGAVISSGGPTGGASRGGRPGSPDADQGTLALHLYIQIGNSRQNDIHLRTHKQNSPSCGEDLKLGWTARLDC
jgi:hypothetical protein